MADISFLVFKDEQGFYRLVGDETKGETVQRVDMTEAEADAFIAAQAPQEISNPTK